MICYTCKKPSHKSSECKELLSRNLSSMAWLLNVSWKKFLSYWKTKKFKPMKFNLEILRTCENLHLKRKPILNFDEIATFFNNIQSSAEPISIVKEFMTDYFHTFHRTRLLKHDAPNWKRSYWIHLVTRRPKMRAIPRKIATDNVIFFFSYLRFSYSHDNVVFFFSHLHFSYSLTLDQFFSRISTDIFTIYLCYK